MSAYIVPDAKILQIVGFAHAYSLRFEHNGRTYRAAEHDTCQTLVDALIGENYASVNYRYREADEAHRIEWSGACNLTPDPLEVAKLVGEYDYQACEHPTYRDSLAAAVVASMKADAAEVITLDDSTLPNGFWDEDNPAEALPDLASESPLTLQPLQPMDRVVTRHARRAGRFVRTYPDGSAGVIWDDGEPPASGFVHERVPRHMLIRIPPHQHP